MKILSYVHAYVGSGHNAGGETTLHDASRYIKTRGHDVTALLSKPCKDGSGSYVVDGVKVQAFASKADPTLYIPAADMVFTHLECSPRAYLIGKGHKKPVVQFVHNNIDWAVKLAEKYADFLIFNSAWIEEDMRAQGVTTPGIVLNPIVDPKRYSVESSREYITLINLSNGKPPFYDKGYRVFYEMARRFPNEKFLGVKGAYGDQHLEDLPNVTIVEHTDNILPIYRKTKILLIPSERETYGRVAVEAAVSGIPSVASDTLGLKEANCSFRYFNYLDMDSWEFELARLLNDSAVYDIAVSNALDLSRLAWRRTQRQIPTFLDSIESLI